MEGFVGVKKVIRGIGDIIPAVKMDKVFTLRRIYQRRIGR
jgi:hypothetical protein